VLMNIECTDTALEELESAFSFNDAVLRRMVIRRPGPDTEPSPLAKGREERDSRIDDDDDDRDDERNEREESAEADE